MSPRHHIFITIIRMKHRNIIRHKRLWQVCALLVVDGVFFTSTNTAQVAPIVLMFGFILFMTTTYEVIYGLLSVARLYGLPIQRKKRLTLYASAVLTIVVALQSLGELSLIELLVLVVLAVLAYFYGIFAATNKQSQEN